ncbi:hypothetical protein D9756_002968 [Leucocoprinus leucothites]|uniref:Uncharacterized protein n=1 Tax=Leucocoprinus leucothites TaxID=201217 RepID=A0A8H5G6K2_9AGAR|nr:hypothetical protein D9756_002968 [Leucoagaricus leucothites]
MALEYSAWIASSVRVTSGVCLVAIKNKQKKPIPRFTIRLKMGIEDQGERVLWVGSDDAT